MIKAVVAGAVALAMVSAASAADLPRREPAPVYAPSVGKAPIGKRPIGKYPQVQPVYTKG